MTDSPVLPPTPSIHGRLLKKRTPQWLIDATSPRREALKRSDAPVPPAYRRAPPEQRQRVHDCIVASFTAQTALDKTMSALQDIETFARPLLVNALKDQFGVTLAPRIETWLSLRKSLQVTHFNVDTLAYDFLKLELLQAALHNFEEAECEQGAFHPSSGFKWQVPTRGVSPQHSLLPLRMRGLEVHQCLQRFSAPPLCLFLQTHALFANNIPGWGKCWAAIELIAVVQTQQHKQPAVLFGGQVHFTGR